MSLVKCKVCEKDVALSAATCPNCGVANPGIVVPETSAVDISTGNGAKIVLGIFLVFILILLFRSPSQNENIATPTTGAQPSVPDQPQIDDMLPTAEVQAQVKSYIESNGMWCGKVIRFREKPFSSSANKKVFRAACDDGREAQNYEIILDRTGNFVTITED